MIKALDVAFSAPHVTPGWCARRMAEGYRLLVVDLWKGNGTIAGAEHALKTWREAGGIIAAYFVVHDGNPAQHHFNQARANAGAEWSRLSFVSVDVEIAPTTAQTVRTACTLVEADGLRPIIYSRLGFWKDELGNTTQLQDVPLWDARFGIPPALGVPGYGGFEKRTGHQHEENILLDGIDVDLNVFDEEFVMPVMPDIAPELDRIWAALDAAQHATTDATLIQLLEDAKQAGVVAIKKKVGLQ